VIKVAVILGFCIAIYAIFSYLETRLVYKLNGELFEDIIYGVVEEFGKEMTPTIINIVSDNITNIFIDHLDTLAKLGVLGVIREATDEYKEKISETRKEDYKKFKGY